MNETGIERCPYKSKNVKEYFEKTHFGTAKTVCMTAEEKSPIITEISTRLYWPFGDPANNKGKDEESPAKFREVKDQADAKIKGWLNEPVSYDFPRGKDA
jgi:arsenate reductase